MIISEIFYTLQGEGRYAGHPCVFIRTSGCNLRCVWCDTPYTSWEPEGSTRSVAKISSETEVWRHVNHVVISGGEPMMQKDMAELVDTLKAHEHFITIETAGTIFAADVQPQFYSISPKLRNSYPGTDYRKEQRIHNSNNTYDALAQFVDCGLDYQFKFVVQGEADTDEIVDLVSRFDVPPERVYLMPEGVNESDLQARSRVIAEICKREGFNFTGRLQIYLWGNTRGT